MSKRFKVVIVTALMVSTAISSPSAGQDALVSRADLVKDTQQLATKLEVSHPDPYSRGGGKVEFHRRLGILQVDIPDEGMTGKQFSQMLLPFVAKVGDSHTGLYLEGAPSPFLQSSEMPLLFRMVERSLFVYGANDPASKQWIGARLESVAGVSFDELLRRQRDLRGIENWVHSRALLGLGLSSRSWLTLLIPEWADHSKLTMELQQPGVSSQVVEFQIPGQVERVPHMADSRLSLPSTDRSEIAWSLLTQPRDVAILRIDSMEGYREAFESFLAEGVTELAGQARSAYERYQGKPAPEDMNTVVNGLPAASDAFAELVEALRTAGTRTLIVDLRRNTGGNSIMKEILVYFLYGNQALKNMDDGYQVVKLSPLYFEMYSNSNLEQINTHRSQPLGPEDYDFSGEIAYRSGDREHFVTNQSQMLEQLKSFQKWYKTGKYHQPRHELTRVIILSSPFTYSSGFNMMQALTAQGALLVGTPSAQPANNFGDSLITRLEHSGITVFISHKVNVSYPLDPAPGHVVQPDHVLTWDRWASWNFDPNAEVLLAFELSAQTGGG